MGGLWIVDSSIFHKPFVLDHGAVVKVRIILDMASTSRFSCVVVDQTTPKRSR
jgi:hypothetical protein